MISLTNWLGLKCRLSMCGGRVDHDKHSVFWRCGECGKMDRAESKGDHWEPLESAAPPAAVFGDNGTSTGQLSNSHRPEG
jgi:hypothetical protein